MSGALRALGPGAFTGAGDTLERPHGNCYWLLPGRILCGEHPGYRDGSDVAERVPLVRRLIDLQSAGVSCLVDLTSPADPVPPYQVLPARGFEGLRLCSPITDFGVPGVAQMQTLLADIEARIDEGRVLYVHCRAGIGRTGTVAACMLVSAGFSAEDALALLQQKWQCVDKRLREPHTPETAAQRSFVRAWAQHVRTTDGRP